MAETIKELLKRNKAWAEQYEKGVENFSFEESAKGQTPEYFWIGCADSRVPAEVLSNSTPGTIFVQRNIANMVVDSDENLMSALYYAVVALKVKNIIVCGHTNCGGVDAAMKGDDLGYDKINNWVKHIRDVYLKHQEEVEAQDGKQAKWDKMVEINVMEQVNNLTQVSFVQDKLKEGALQIHGLVYNLASGTLEKVGEPVSSVEA